MLTTSDFITLPYTPDLTQAGIAYACRSLPHTYNRMGGSRIERLRRIVGGIAVELAFRRYLSSRDVPFDTLGATPFTEPDRYDVSLGRRRCDVKSFLIFQKPEISRIRQEPGRLLTGSALVPSDQLASDHLQDRDIYIFAFVTALVTERQEELERARHAGQPIYLIHPFPEAWNQPTAWASLGRLALKSEAGQEIDLEIGGQGQNREFLAESIHLPSGASALARHDFYSVAYIHVSEPAQGRIGLHSPARRSTRVIPPADWGNIWVYGMQIILTGYMTRGEFRSRARPLPAGSSVLQYRRTRTENMALSIGELRPLGDLFERVKEWSGSV
jgi:hypothetical protein